ncbi:probable deoxyguanosinetriphosphate triphosphohydrolase [Psychrobacter arcticus 273-4]|uniref:Probable deoxyguanosinetriphosphate triphosphohydrolase n=1 Tax=Psychrobacter arcticus (strain DSM 17307 / VKM B-2377 / 273-4) TaxID=259536 RepID=Q4FTB2_PSYA2|nr:deoxyguanosinetriphosphate triphosphohydrolase [Psychrobacter arcticus]AAZ18746.1 probable deoxyguanosinetriphosphate triphosphohydrolase [Psychrobacter arcticus 273-4]
MTAPINKPLNSRSHWAKLFSAQRLGSNKKAPAQDSARSSFHKDYDRLVFSHSFRQLNQKTQVHPLTNQLGIHTRLTHSLEVSCIGRSLGVMAAEKLHNKLEGGLPDGVTAADVGVIVQAACLAHDIGNPPFGHAGEYAIRDWFMHSERQAILQNMSSNEQLDLLAYEGNAQGFRILTRNEHHPDAGGMRLTCATLGAFMKYPWLATHSNNDIQNSHQNSHQNNVSTKVQKFGCFYSEAAQLEELAACLGLPRSEHHGGFARHPLAYLLEAADDICYALIDLEDGINLNMLTYAEVAAIFYELIGERPSAISLPAHMSIRQHLASLRARAMMRLVNSVTDAFVANSDMMLAGTLNGSLFAHCDATVQSGITQAKDLAREKIFNHPSKVRMELMANQCLHRLLDAFMPLAWTNEISTPMSFEQQRLLRLLQPHLDEHHRVLSADIYQNMLNVLDFVTGMNDHEAYRLAQELQGHWGTIV